MGKAYTLGNQMSLPQTYIRRCHFSILVNNFVSLKKIHRLTALRRHQMKLEITKQLFPVDIVSGQLHLSTDIEDLNDSQINQLVIRWAVKYLDPHWQQEVVGIALEWQLADRVGYRLGGIWEPARQLTCGKTVTMQPSAGWSCSGWWAAWH